MLGMLEVTTTLEVTDEVSLTLEEVVTTLDTDTVFTAGTLGLLRPNVEKSKSSGFSDVSPCFSKKLLSSLRDLNLFPVGPMIKTSYLPADAPLFL